MERSPDAPQPPSIDAIAATFGLDAGGAEVVRSASRHVVRFGASQVRTFAVPAGTGGPRDEAAIATLLADAGVSAARRLAGPARVEDWSVTAWREIPAALDGVPEPDAATVGALAAELHRGTRSLDLSGISPCDPVGAARAQLERAGRAGASSQGDLSFLRDEANRLEPTWDAAVDRARRHRPADSPELDGSVVDGSVVDRSGVDEVGGAVLHGDLHPGNVVVGRDGPVLVDLELAGWGPCAFDAAPTVALVRWYGRTTDDLATFDDAYGAPLTGRAAAGGLDQVWALWATCWAVANRHRSSEAEAEAGLRVASLAQGEAPRPWRLR